MSTERRREYTFPSRPTQSSSTRARRLERAEATLARAEQRIGALNRTALEPLVDAAIEDGRLARDARDVTLWAAEVAPEIVRRSLEEARPDPLLASRNYFAEGTNDEDYRRQAAAELGIDPSEIV